MYSVECRMQIVDELWIFDEIIVKLYEFQTNNSTNENQTNESDCIFAEIFPKAITISRYILFTFLTLVSSANLKIFNRHGWNKYI